MVGERETPDELRKRLVPERVEPRVTEPPDSVDTMEDGTRIP